jgi:hypothetical protein
MFDPDPDVDPSIPFGPVTGLLMLDIFFDKPVHYQIVHLLLSQCRQLVKTKALPSHLCALCCPPRSVPLYVSWYVSGCVYLVYDKIFKDSSDSVNYI